MEATVESVSALIKAWTNNQVKLVTSDKVAYLVEEGDYAAHVMMCPVTIDGPNGPIYGINICQTFCYQDGQPVNIKPHLEGDRTKLFHCFDEMSVWGRISFDDIGDEEVVMTHDRYIIISEDEVDADTEDIQNSKFLQYAGYMLEEWREMKNMLILLIDHSGSDSEVEGKVDLLLRPSEGHC